MTQHRICLDCQQLTPTAHSRAGRCPTCYTTYHKRRNQQRTQPKTNTNRRIRQSIYQTPAWRKARKQAITRDQTCTNCDNPTGLSVHHIRSITEAPDLAYDLDNLITLCQKCHATLENHKRAALARKRLQGGWFVC